MLLLRSVDFKRFVSYVTAMCDVRRMRDGRAETTIKCLKGIAKRLKEIVKRFKENRKRLKENRKCLRNSKAF